MKTLIKKILGFISEKLSSSSKLTVKTQVKKTDNSIHDNDMYNNIGVVYKNCKNSGNININTQDKKEDNEFLYVLVIIFLLLAAIKFWWIIIPLSIVVIVIQISLYVDSEGNIIPNIFNGLASKVCFLISILTSLSPIILPIIFKLLNEETDSIYRVILYISLGAYVILLFVLQIFNLKNIISKKKNIDSQINNKICGIFLFCLIFFGCGGVYYISKNWNNISSITTQVFSSLLQNINL